MEKTNNKENLRDLNIATKLQKIQCELKAPKNLFNKFGGYNYRNAEGILEAFKPYGEKYGCAVCLNDEIVLVGDRFYLKAIATLIDCNTGEKISVNAFAREAMTKKGMDESQITGSSSSYARKYALNGLFLLDDTKDADTEEQHNEIQKKSQQQGQHQGQQQANKPNKTNSHKKATESQVSMIKDLVKSQPERLSGMLEYYGVGTVEELSIQDASQAIKALQTQK